MKLASIEKILEVKTHPNADSLELANVLGYQVVVKKGEYKTGDLCIYIPTDTIVPERSELEFMRNKDWRVKAIRLRGEKSFGLCLPIALLPQNEYQEGDDVGEILGVKKYEKPLPPEMMGKAKGSLPSFIRKTDEDNLRSNPKVLNELQGKECYITMKYDGQSGSFYLRKEDELYRFGVCSRNLDLTEGESRFWTIARQYKIEEALRNLQGEYCLQGELYGNGIQGNKLGLKDVQMVAFNLWDIAKQKFCDFPMLVDFCNVYHIPMPKFIWKGIFNFTLQELIDMANGLTYDNGSPSEGIVIRSMEENYSVYLGGRLSCKVISENFQLKYKE